MKNFELALEIGVDFAYPVHSADKPDGDVFLHLVRHGSGETDDSSRGIDTEMASVEGAVHREIALGGSLDLCVIRRLNELDEIRDAGVAEISGDRGGGCSVRGVDCLPADHDDVADLRDSQTLDDHPALEEGGSEIGRGRRRLRRNTRSGKEYREGECDQERRRAFHGYLELRP